MGWLLADVNADSAIRVGDEPFELGCVDRCGVHVEAARASAEGLDWRIRSIDHNRQEAAFEATVSIRRRRLISLIHVTVDSPEHAKRQSRDLRNLNAAMPRSP